MNVAVIFATDGSSGEDAVLAPFRMAGFVEGLRTGGVDTLVITVADEAGGAPRVTPTDNTRVCPRDQLPKLLAAERPDVVQTFGPEGRLASIWTLVAEAKLPIVHCVSCWRDILDPVPRSPRISSFAASWAKRASRAATTVVGTSRAAVGRLLADGYFPHATSSLMVPPPVERAAVAAPPPAPADDGSSPVFGVYDPHGGVDVAAFVSRAMELHGRRGEAQTRIAVGPSLAASAPSAPSVSIEPARGIEPFLAGIDVLAIPAYDDGLAGALIAAMRAGKSVIVPDPSGAAELIEYGRHGVMFSAGSAYHFAGAMDLVGQSWNQRPIMFAEGGSALARTHPAAASRAFATLYARLRSAGDDATPRRPSHG